VVNLRQALRIVKGRLIEVNLSQFEQRLDAFQLGIAKDYSGTEKATTDSVCVPLSL
jgi:hypothetical protein